MRISKSHFEIKDRTRKPKAAQETCSPFGSLRKKKVAIPYTLYLSSKRMNYFYSCLIINSTHSLLRYTVCIGVLFSRCPIFMVTHATQTKTQHCYIMRRLSPSTLYDCCSQKCLIFLRCHALTKGFQLKMYSFGRRVELGLPQT